MTNLPPETITEILIRLPVKSLLRFRCVSKPWCAMIDGPDFIKLHLQQSIKNTSGLSLILGGTGNLYSLDFRKLRRLRDLKIPVSGHADVVGSCNGLLLLQMKDIALFNPATREFKVLPPPKGQTMDPNAITAFEKFSLGFDSVNDDYKVLRLNELKGRNYKWIGTKSQIYSLKSNSWKEIEDFPFQTPFKRVWGVHLNGVLHTVVNDEKLMAFNIVTEKSYQMPLPEFSDNTYYDLGVEVFDGCLCVRAIYDGSRAEMWVMEEYGVKSSWVKLLTIAPPLIKSFVTVNPLAYSDNRREVLLNYDDKALIWYDLKKIKIRWAPFVSLSPPFYTELCVGSLVSLGVKRKAIEKKKEVAVEKPKEMKKNKNRDGFLSTGFKLVL